MKTILAGVDGSATADAAARTAAGLAQMANATLLIASAYGKLEVERIETGSDQYFFSNENDALATAQRSASALRTDFPDLTVRAHAVEGKAADALVAFAADNAVDLVVVGNKRVQGISRVLGSIAGEVTRKAPCDVYIAHTH